MEIEIQALIYSSQYVQIIRDTQRQPLLYMLSKIIGNMTSYNQVSISKYNRRLEQ